MFECELEASQIAPRPALAEMWKLNESRSIVLLFLYIHPKRFLKEHSYLYATFCFHEIRTIIYQLRLIQRLIYYQSKDIVRNSQNLKKIYHLFLYSLNVKTIGRFFQTFCCLFRKPELYIRQLLHKIFAPHFELCTMYMPHAKMRRET